MTQPPANSVLASVRGSCSTERTSVIVDMRRESGRRLQPSFLYGLPGGRVNFDVDIAVRLFNFDVVYFGCGDLWTWTRTYLKSVFTWIGAVLVDCDLVRLKSWCCGLQPSKLARVEITGTVCRYGDTLVAVVYLHELGV